MRSSADRPRVVVVDDEPAILHSTAALLEDLGYDVHVCSDVARIVEAVTHHEARLLLQDVRMPGLDLEKLVFTLRERHPTLSIILFTASMDAEEVAQRVHANGVLEKPFRPNDLLQALEAALAAPA